MTWKIGLVSVKVTLFLRQPHRNSKLNIASEK